MFSSHASASDPSDEPQNLGNLAFSSSLCALLSDGFAGSSTECEFPPVSRSSRDINASDMRWNDLIIVSTSPVRMDSLSSIRGGIAAAMGVGERRTPHPRRALPLRPPRSIVNPDSRYKRVRFSTSCILNKIKQLIKQGSSAEKWAWSKVTTSSDTICNNPQV